MESKNFKRYIFVEFEEKRVFMFHSENFSVNEKEMPRKYEEMILFLERKRL